MAEAGARRDQAVGRPLGTALETRHGVRESVTGGRERLCPQRRPGLKQEAPSEWPPDPLLVLPVPA